MYHDAFREVTYGALAPIRRRAVHRAWAQAFEAADETTSEHVDHLRHHWREAGEPEQGYRYLLLAADQSAGQLAFGRASELYQEAIAEREAAGASPSELRPLLTKLGEALTNAGRGAQAADAYLRAAQGAPSDRALALRQEAALQLVNSGRADEALAVIRDVLAGVGLELPTYELWNKLKILGRRARLRLRGLELREREPDAIPAELLLRTDACMCVLKAMVVLDPFATMLDFLTRGLLNALEAGDPGRVARFLAFEAWVPACMGNGVRSDKLLAKADALAKSAADPAAIGLVEAVGAVSAVYLGRLSDVLPHFDRAESALLEAPGSWWELANVRALRRWALYLRGALEELRDGLSQALEDARLRGDHYAQTILGGMVLNWACLANDDLELAEREVPPNIAILENVGDRGVSFPVHWQMYTGAERALYAGRGAEAWAGLQALWPAFKSTLPGQVMALVRFEAWFVRGRCAVAAAVEADGSERAALLREAGRAARKLDREKLAAARIAADLVRAGVASVKGDDEEAARLLATTAAAFDREQMALHAAVARKRNGTLLGGDAGAELSTRAASYMVEEAIERPDRMCDLMAPGRWSRD